ncbi:MAG: hypothetical protein WBV94_09005 [Blastocatellia bacterium]
MEDQEDLQSGAPGAPASEEKIDVAELQRQLDTEKQLRQAAEQERERWQQAATAKPAEKQPEKKEEVPELEDLSKTDLVDLISGNNVEGLSKVVQTIIKKTLRESGVTTKKDVEELVSSRVEASSQQQQQLAALVEELPDLADPQSELRLEAARQLETINKDTAYKGLDDFGRIKLAASLANAKLSGSGKSSGQERARVARIGAQQVTTSNRSNRSEESDELTESEKLAAHTYKISEEDFKKNKAAMRSRR